MSTGQTDIDIVREATDLVVLIGEHVALRQRGREHVGLCPFHDDHSPSMAVVTHKGNAFFKCHSCGAAGDAFNFVMDYHKKDFAEALSFLADRAGITLSRNSGESRRRDGAPTRADLRAANGYAAKLFTRTLREGERGASAVQLLADRGIDESMITMFDLGLAPEGFSGLFDRLAKDTRSIQVAAAAGLLKQRPDGGHYDTFRNRLIFPICNEIGQPIAFGARAIETDDQPKYLNSPESTIFLKSRTLYGLHLARLNIIKAKQAIITEGYTDVIACHKAGLNNAVATLGTALTSDHARILSKICDSVILIFDGDEAGQRAADRALEVFFSVPVDIRICTLPEGQDPDTLLRQENGLPLFQQAVDDAEDALTHKVGRFSSILKDQTTIAGREKALITLLNELSSMGFSTVQGVRKSWVFARLSELLGVPIRDIEQMMPRRRPRRTAANLQPGVSSAGLPQGAPGHGSTGQSETASEMIELKVSRINRARRLAEREVLALLIYDPSLGSQPIDEIPGSAETASAETASPETDSTQTASPAHELLTLDIFNDETSRVIAEFVLAKARAGTVFGTSDLIHALQDNDHRSTALDLYSEGRRIVESLDTHDGADSASAFADSVRSLLNCIRNDRYRHSAGQTAIRTAEAGSQLDMFHELLKQRRECGDIPTAITVESRT